MPDLRCGLFFGPDFCLEIKGRIHWALPVPAIFAVYLKLQSLPPI
jgi:hypothetical protein